MYSLYLHVMDGGHFQACGASPCISSLQELSGGRSTLGARHLRPSRLSESAVRTTTWSPAAAPPLLLPSPVTTGCTNISARAQVRKFAGSFNWYEMSFFGRDPSEASLVSKELKS